MSHSARWLHFSFPLCISHIYFISLSLYGPFFPFPCACSCVLCLYLIHPFAMSFHPSLLLSHSLLVFPPQSFLFPSFHPVRWLLVNMEVMPSPALPSQPDNKGLSVRERQSFCLSPTRQANRRHSQIRIMRGTLAWTDWNDTHTGAWSHKYTHTQTHTYTHSVMPFQQSAYLFVCQSVFMSTHSSVFSCSGMMIWTWESHFSLSPFV